MSEISKKVEFIIDWYTKERIRFSFSKQIVLANTWIEICTRNEEYEMAAALTKEKDDLIKKNLKKNRESRGYVEKLLYFLIKIKRKLNKKRG